MSFRSLTGEQWVTSEQKRDLDRAFALAAFPIAAPIGGIALGLSRILEGEGALFRQKRIGRNEESFWVSKIRSMKSVSPDCEATGLDNEITPLGRIMRPLAIDEIPQLVSIIKGDMSIVGPRARPASSLEDIQAAVPKPTFDEWWECYCLSRPGGLSSFNIENRMNRMTEQSWRQITTMDIDDFHNASFNHDLMLVRKAASAGIRYLTYGNSAREQSFQETKENT